MPEPLTSEILTQTVLQVQEGGLPVLNHQDAWRVTPDLMAAMERLMAIVNWVRSPAGGWPTDRVVNAENLLPYVMDEALDVLDCLEKSWMHPGLPSSHPFFPLQKLLKDRLILSDAVSQLLWGVARASVETMQLLGGIPAELFQAGKEWTPGILRLMAILTIQTPNFEWQMDLVTAAPPLPELHPDSLLRWSNSSVFWAEGLLQTLQKTIAHNTLPLQNLLTQTVPSEIIAPSQPWQKGTLSLSLGFTFAPHATKPVLSVLPSTLAVAEPPKPDWHDYNFSPLNLQPQGMASIPTLPVPPRYTPRDEVRDEIGDQVRDDETIVSLAGSVTPDAPVVDAAETIEDAPPPLKDEETEALFDDTWFSGLGAPSPAMEDEDPVHQSVHQYVGAEFPDPGQVQADPADDDLFGEAFSEEALSQVFLGESATGEVTNNDGLHDDLFHDDLFDGWGGETSDRPQIQQPVTTDLQSTSSPGSEPDFEIVLDASLLAAPAQTSVDRRYETPLTNAPGKGSPVNEDPLISVEIQSGANNSKNHPAEVVLDDTENWNLEQWTIRWSADHTSLESDRLQLPRSYHVKTLLHRLGTTGKVTQPSLNKEHHLVEIIDLACEALQLPDPPPTLLNINFVSSESTLAALVHRLTWEIIRNSYGLTCLLSGIPAQILQPEWGWESGVLRLLPILKVQSLKMQSLNVPSLNLQNATDSDVIDFQVDLGTGAPAPLETILLLPDILVSIDGSDWQQTRESAVEFRSGLLKQIYQLLPELEVLCCPVPVELATAHGAWQPATLHLQFELGFQGN